MQWLKLQTDILNDDKINVIRSMPEGDSLFVLWIGLLCIAMKQETQNLYIADGIPYTTESLSRQLRIDKQVVELGLQTFQKLQMIDIADAITITNFTKHQDVDAAKRKRELSAVRSQQYRDRKRLDDSVTRDGMTRHALELEIELEKEKEKRVDTYCESYPQGFEDFCTAYPKHVEKAKTYTQYEILIRTQIQPHSILTAAKNYAKMAKAEGTETKYIKAAHNFLKDAWRDYLAYRAPPKEGVSGWTCKCGHVNNTTGKICGKCGEFRE